MFLYYAFVMGWKRDKKSWKVFKNQVVYLDSHGLVFKNYYKYSTTARRMYVFIQYGPWPWTFVCDLT